MEEVLHCGDTGVLNGGLTPLHTTTLAPKPNPAFLHGHSGLTELPALTQLCYLAD